MRVGRQLLREWKRVPPTIWIVLGLRWVGGAVWMPPVEVKGSILERCLDSWVVVRKTGERTREKDQIRNCGVALVAIARARPDVARFKPTRVVPPNAEGLFDRVIGVRVVIESDAIHDCAAALTLFPAQTSRPGEVTERPSLSQKPLRHLGARPK